MPQRSRILRSALLGTIALLTVAPVVRGQAQPMPEPSEYSLVLRKLIDDVQLERRVLVRTNRGFVAIPVDSIGKLYASRVFTGELDPDSVAPRARWVRQESKRWLAMLIRDLANLDATGAMPGAPSGDYRRWDAQDGTWSMSCSGKFPAQVRGQIGGVDRVDTPDGRKLLRFDVYRELRGLVAPVRGTIEGNTSKGERRQVQIPGPDFLEDVGTLTWNVIVWETKPATGAVDGTIAFRGELVYTGYEGRCSGLLEAG